MSCSCALLLVAGGQQMRAYPDMMRRFLAMVTAARERFLRGMPNSLGHIDCGILFEVEGELRAEPTPQLMATA